MEAMGFMDRRSFLASVMAGGSALALRRRATAQILPHATRPASPAEQSETIRVAASAFLRTLAPEQRDRVTFPFPKDESPAAIGFGPGFGQRGIPSDPGRPHHDVSFDVDGHPRADAGPGGKPPRERFGGAPPVAAEGYGKAVWTNFPVDIVPRPGVRMGDLTVAGRDAAHGLLRVILSPMGYRKVLDIMAADQIVADAGADYAAGLDVYTLALFGRPDAASPWMVQFGGHHLGLNVIFAGDKAVCAPLHTGILPARFEQDGTVIRGLGRENDTAFDLLASFTPDQREAASIDHDVSELVLGPGHFDAKLSPQGLLGSDMSMEQRMKMLSLASEWAGVLNAAHAAGRLKELRASLPDTRFAWSGPATHEAGQNGEAYFRIHGPSLLIEHAPQRNQGGYKVHVHTIMRDLGNDYGRRLV